MPELADILRLHGPEYIAKYQSRLLPSHRRTIHDICACRTEALGGHLYHCPQCQQEHYRYHSCKNRHCPKCQNDQAERWIEQHRALLLPVLYFMATFTLPHGLRRLARSHQKVLYHLLFQASQKALQKLASDPKYIGGTLGMIGLLQSWTRELRYHPHVHYLIPGGGLAPDHHTWRPARYNYLLPEKPLAHIFRAKFRDLLKKAGLFDQVPPRVWHQQWVVDIIPVGNGEAALKYLAPYVFRVAISNRNILDLKDDQLTFRYRHSNTNTTHTITLPVEQFIHRFLQHVLPRGFQKVRYFGLLHPKQRRLFAIVKEQRKPDTPQQALDHSSDSPPAKHPSCRLNPVLCPNCACEMIHLRQIQPKRGPP
jgi:hypothetical protein